MRDELSTTTFMTPVSSHHQNDDAIKTDTTAVDAGKGRGIVIVDSLLLGYLPLPLEAFTQERYQHWLGGSRLIRQGK